MSGNLADASSSEEALSCRSDEEEPAAAPATTRSGSQEGAGAASGGEAPTPGPPPLQRPSFADVVFILEGRRYSASAAEYPGFQDRVTGTMLDAMTSGPSRTMVRRNEDGAFVLLAEHLPEEVVEWFPDIWTYLLDGEWPTPAATLRDHMRRQRAQAFLAIEEERTAALVFGKNLVNLPEAKQLGASCMRFEDNGARKVPLETVGVWATSEEGTSVLKVGPRSMVKLQGEEIYVKFDESSNYLYIARHKMLKTRQLRAAIMRGYTSQYPKFGSGAVLFLHAAPRTRHPVELSPVAAWPACWLVVYARKDGRDSYSCQSCEALPGGLQELSDGSLVMLSKHESLRHMLLSIYLAKDGVLGVPPILVNPIAPQPYFGLVREPDRRFRMKGKGKGPGSGRKRQDLHHTEPAAMRFPCLRTLHPHGRAPAAIWIAGRGQQRVLLIHAVDGRVALAQISGPGGAMPPLPLDETSHWHTYRGKSMRWDVWCRRDGDCFDLGGGTPCGRLALRRRFAVPICNEVLAVLPRREEVIIVHRLHQGDAARVFRAPVSQDGTLLGSFVPVVGRGWDYASTKGKGRGNLKGSWIEHHWHGGAPCNLPVEIDGKRACEVLPGELEQPLFEFQRWQVLRPGAQPVMLRASHPGGHTGHTGTLPAIVGKAGSSPWDSRPRCPTMPFAPRDHTRAPHLQRSGRHPDPLVEHWAVIADV